MTDKSTLEKVAEQMEGMSGTVEKMRDELRAAAPAASAVIRMDSGGMAMVLAGAATAIAIASMAGLICVLVWTTGQLSDMRNKDAVHDAYLDQHASRIHKLEKSK